MKKMAIWATIFVAVLFFLVILFLNHQGGDISPLIDTEINPTQVLPAESEYVVVADVDFIGIAFDRYHWTAAEIWWPDRDCFSASTSVESITFHVKEGYGVREGKPHEFCAVRLK